MDHDRSASPAADAVESGNTSESRPSAAPFRLARTPPWWKQYREARGAAPRPDDPAPGGTPPERRDRGRRRKIVDDLEPPSIPPYRGPSRALNSSRDLQPPQACCCPHNRA